MTIRSIALAIALLGIAPAAEAHEDRILSLRADGSIPEIPATFGAVSFRARFGPPVEVVFRVDGRTTVVPACITRLIPSQSLRDIDLSGSWYHDERILPFYVAADFLPPDRNEDAGKAVSVIFNLHDASIVQVWAPEPGVSPEEGRRRYSLQELCGDEASGAVYRPLSPNGPDA